MFGTNNDENVGGQLELKECSVCGMKGIKKLRVIRKGLERTIVYKCMYCEDETYKTL